MGKRGPQPLPTRLRVLRGETRPSRVNYHEPMPAEGEPQMPASLSEEARPVWDEVLEHMRAMRVLTPVDSETLAVFCEHVVNHRELVNLVRKSGMMIRGKDNQPVKNPLVGMMRSEALVLRGFAQEFGLTPAARTSLIAGAEATESDVERLLS